MTLTEEKPAVQNALPLPPQGQPARLTPSPTPSQPVGKLATKLTPTATPSRPSTAPSAPVPALVASTPDPAPDSEKEVAKEPLWRNPLTWLIGADVVFVVLAGWIAVAGQSPIRWLGVILLMIIAGSVGVVGYCLPGATPPPPLAPSKVDPAEKRKIRVHFVDELPKRRN